ncbi:MAG TPA: type II toxin-antitoxin system RelE/ParE family toxin [Caulobacteraceae bacterium]
MKHRVAFSPRAQQDLDDLYAWLAEEAGNWVARRYADRLRGYCQRMDLFPHRGTLRNDIRPGLRIVGFEKRATISFYITENIVVITRVLYGGRNVEDHLGEAEGER